MHTAPLWAAIAAGNLVSAIWQGAVLAAAVALCLRLLPRLSAAARSLVWMNVFALLVLLHVLPMLGGAAGAGIAGSSAGHGAGPVSGPASGLRLNLSYGWSLAIAGAWMALSLWRAAQLALSAARLRGLARRAVPVATDAATGALLGFGRNGRRAELCRSDEVARPSVFGFFRPRILLPPALVEGLSEQELRQVIVHEMEHLRRGDDWTNLLQKVALVLFPLNPALQWVERKLCAERELACDDRVLREGAGSKAYAMCLARLAEFTLARRSLSLALGAWERRPELVRRVHRLLMHPDPAMSRLQVRVVVGSLMTAVFVGALALAHSPQFVGFAAPTALTVDLSDTAAGPAQLAAPMQQPGLQQQTPSWQEAAPHAVETKATVKCKQISCARAAAKILRKPALERRAKPQPDPAFLVLTDWNEMEIPPQAVLLQVRGQGTYAAVRMANGWLIVQI